MMRGFERAIEFVLRWEGGFSNDPADPGNWTGGKVGEGALVGTKYGISAAVYADDFDIPNLTLEQAIGIYKKDYWDALNLDSVDDDNLALLVMDSAVQHGRGRAAEWLWAHPTVADYFSTRMKFYTNLTDFRTFGKGWMRRMAALAMEIFGVETDPLSGVRRFFLVLFGAVQLQLPYKKARIIGDKLYVRLFGPRE